MNISTGIKRNYNHTLYASYIGYITQAIINNFVPLFISDLSGSFPGIPGENKFTGISEFWCSVTY